MTPISFQSSTGTVLSGILTHCDSRDAVVMVHDFLGDKEGNGLFTQAAAALKARGWGSLRFDQSGCGQSSDAMLSTAIAIQDVFDAIELMRACGYRRIALWAQGLGARWCLPWHAAVVAAVYCDPTLMAFTIDRAAVFGRFGPSSLMRDGFIRHRGSDGLRREHHISARLIESFSTFAAADPLRRMRSPTLCIASTRTDLDHAVMHELEQHLPASCRYELLAEFHRRLTDRHSWLIGRAIDWIETRSLPAAPAAKGRCDHISCQSPRPPAQTALLRETA